MSTPITPASSVNSTRQSAQLAVGLLALRDQNRDGKLSAEEAGLKDRPELTLAGDSLQLAIRGLSQAERDSLDATLQEMARDKGKVPLSVKLLGGGLVLGLAGIAGSFVKVPVVQLAATIAKYTGLPAAIYGLCRGAYGAEYEARMSRLAVQHERVDVQGRALFGVR